MEFAQGPIMRWTAPPVTLPTQAIHFFAPAEAAATVGQNVRRGQVLFDPPQEDRTCLFSPVDGIIREVRRGANDVEIIIEPEAAEVATSMDIEPPRGRVLADWFACLRQWGPWCDGDPAFDLLSQMHVARQKQPIMLICVGLDAFAPYPDRSSLLMSFSDDAVLGTQVLADLLGVKRVLMLGPMVRAVMSRLRSSCRNFRVPLSAVHNIYPSAHPTLVAWSYARRRRRLPPGTLPAERGIVMIGPWTAIRLARWFTRRELDLAHPLMIGWPQRAASATCAWTLPGQPLVAVHPALADASQSLVAGHPMTGRPVQNRVAAMDQPLLSVVPPLLPSRAEPCISCGWCAEVCPTDLRPIHLVQQIEKRVPLRPRTEKALQWCIDCGLCSHVCPSHIPLAQTIRAHHDRTPST